MNKMLYAAVCIVPLFAAACGDWTDPEGLKISYPAPGETNPELYGLYLKALREYKADNHKIMLVSVDNRESEAPRRNERPEILPDSVDFISLEQPDKLHPQFLAECAAVREKGTRVVYPVSYDLIEARWEKIVEAESKPGAQGEPEDAGQLENRFLDFCDGELAAGLALCDKYGYDGVIVCYAGRSTLNMTESEKSRYATRQQLFLTKVGEWRSAHEDKQLFFRGNPQYLLDMALLARCSYIVVPSFEATSVEEIAFTMLMNAAEGVPADRFLIGVSIPSASNPSNLAGYFDGTDAEGNPRYALPEAAQWVTLPAAGYGKLGLFVDNAQDDYFNLTSNYKHIREAIDTMNPSPKN